jgi:hypothetical protein
MLAHNATVPPIEPNALIDDVYFREDFVRMHARFGYDYVSCDGFRHGAALTPIAGAARDDLETAWGYGGPLAFDAETLARNLAKWRERQRAFGRVAEFIRLHPFLNPEALRKSVDMLRFNRSTVVVDLTQSVEAQWKFYSDSTRNCIRKARRGLKIREIRQDEAGLFRRLYQAGLDRNLAAREYYLDENYFHELLGASWCKAWVVEDAEGAVAVGSFLRGCAPLCHYHLSGGVERARRSNAHYLMLDAAMQFYADDGATFMHLGGGRTAAEDDPLFRFKSKFSPLKLDYCIGGMIHDATAYRQLGGGRSRFLCEGEQ